MKFLRDRSIKNKIVIMNLSITFIVTIIALFIFTVTEMNLQKNDLINDVKLDTKILKEAIYASLDFNFKKDANIILKKMSIKPYLRDCIIFDNNNDFFVSLTEKKYKKSNFLFKPDNDFYFNQDGFYYKSDILNRKQNKIGNIITIISTKIYKDRIAAFLIKMLLIFFLIFILTFILSNIMQKFISEPILNLSKITKNIKSKDDLSIEVIHKNKDEIGQLYKNFNTMIKTLRTIEIEREKTEEEQNKLRQQLQQAQKMEAIGTLAGGIAHDFNNILAIIMGYTEMTIDDPSDLQVTLNNMQNVMKASERAKEMVKQILAFSRKNEETMRSVNIGEIIVETVNFLRSSIPSTIEIKSNIEDNLSQILGNSTQINQILMNLCTNATHAMKDDGGLLEISIKEVFLDNDNSEVIGLSSGIYQQLSVSDTGDGMSKEIMDRIFEPYFTTKKEGEGTGMGLAVIYGIIKSHNGIIKVYSEPGNGTTFNVYFSVSDQSGAIKMDKEQEITFQGNKERILLVDDEAPLLNLSAKLLMKLGYKVDGTNISTEALGIFKANPDKFDLIITDMTMPNMTGIKLAEEIHKIKPDIPVILCTGFSNGINRDNFKDKGISALVMKPVSKNELAKVVWNIFENK